MKKSSRVWTLRYFLYSLPMLLSCLSPFEASVSLNKPLPLVHMTNFHPGDPTMYVMAPNREGETVLHVKNLPEERNLDLHALTRPVYKGRVVESKKSDPTEVLPRAWGYS
ncbi:hypothetical protein K443DRAFT_140800 [Laccaria amethystina LaAM-08-1]|uniref:Uncharacterized protein n=1 Tax=Laccaria amethystina LaAM-08-1 TaxID=1095629 RepID=A0A0C9Y7Z1_9AGAR|nr:hypothetical protein K443DRAFT_140800 [Laccaria amethystina LaAM-08-1]